MTILLSFDPSLKSTGWSCFEREKGSIKLLDCGRIITKMSGSRWWEYDRYFKFFDGVDNLFERWKPDDVALEAIVWSEPSTPALFALHPKIWDWCRKYRCRMVYADPNRWAYWMLERFNIPYHKYDIEGKAIARGLMKEHTGINPDTHDVSDSWMIGLFVDAFLRFLDGEIKNLKPKEQKYFNDVTQRVGPSGSNVTVKRGLLHEKGTNWKDWGDG